MAAAAAEIVGSAAARMAAPAVRPAPPAAAAAAAPPQPRRAVAARSLRTSTSDRVAADLALGSNGSLSAQVSLSLSPLARLVTSGCFFGGFVTVSYHVEAIGSQALGLIRRFLVLRFACLGE